MAGELHRYAAQSKCRQDIEQENEDLGKWKIILQDKDDTRVLQVVDWKDNVNMSAQNNDTGLSD